MTLYEVKRNAGKAIVLPDPAGGEGATGWIAGTAGSQVLVFWEATGTFAPVEPHRIYLLGQSWEQQRNGEMLEMDEEEMIEELRALSRGCKKVI